MNYAVTGATGFIGSHLVQALARSGLPVRALVRRAGNPPASIASTVETLFTDIGDPQSLTDALDNVDVVFHCAGLVSDWGRPSQFDAVNVKGTSNLLSACRQRCVKRLIVFSSLAVYGIRNHNGTNEEAALRRSGDHYSDSKISAELALRDHLYGTGPAITILRPGFVYGPGDKKFLPALVSALRSGKFAYIGSPDNILDIVFIYDLIRASLQAVNLPIAAGRVYNITDGTRTTVRQFVTELTKLTGLPLPDRCIPYALARALCLLYEALAQLSRSRPKPRLTRAALKLLGVSRCFDISRARRELGYIPTVTYREGLRVALQHLELAPAALAVQEPGLGKGRSLHRSEAS